MGRILTGETEQEYRQLKLSKWTSQTIEAYNLLDKQQLSVTRQRLQLLLDKEVFYCQIQEVEDVEYDGWVYDFEVREHHNFVANNILCHKHNSSYCLSIASQRTGGIRVTNVAGLPDFSAGELGTRSQEIWFLAESYSSPRR